MGICDKADKKKPSIPDGMLGSYGLTGQSSLLHQQQRVSLQDQFCWYCCITPLSMAIGPL